MLEEEPETLTNNFTGRLVVSGLDTFLNLPLTFLFQIETRRRIATEQWLLFLSRKKVRINALKLLALRFGQRAEFLIARPL